MRWNKIGFVEVPSNLYTWMHSHCQLPTALPIDDERVRVFYASRTETQRSHIGYVDLAFSQSGDSFEVEKISDKPVLEPGPIGFFDEHGVYPSSILYHEGRYYLYYIGWNRGVEEPLFYANIGLAISDDGINFDRYSIAPIMSRSEYDPCLVTSPDVYVEYDVWRMTYVSGIKWYRDEATNKLMSSYHIKYAEANNPYDWKRDGRIAIDFQPGDTHIARSSVIKVGPTDYKMWFSFVHSDIGKYRIGYAESNDGYDWIRKDELCGIGIDDEYAHDMICYPNVFELNGHIYMAYNGDNFGEKGFGIALLE